MKKKIVVNSKYNDLRLDKYLTLVNENYSREYFSYLIKHDGVLVNDKIIKSPSYKIKENEEIEYELKKYKENYQKLDEIKPYNFDLDIIYQDDDILIINKPKGLVVHPGNNHIDDTLVNALIYNNITLSSLNGLYRVGIVHRIDKDTSGLLIIAKNDYVHNLLGEMIKKHDVKRSYIALVDGIIEENRGKIVGKIERDKENRLKMTIDEINGKDAITHFEVLKRYDKYTLIKCDLETGRTHQIRVHMSHINHPIVGDTLYKGSNYIYNNGQLLHAYKLEFIHPILNKKMVFETKLPSYFEEVLNKLN